MKKLLIAAMMVLFSENAGATINMDNNMQEVACDWSDSHVIKKSDTCYIMSRGTVHGETVQVLNIGKSTYEYILRLETAVAEMVNGDKVIWTGKIIMNRYAIDKNQTNVQTIKLNNGTLVELYYSDSDE